MLTFSYSTEPCFSCSFNDIVAFFPQQINDLRPDTSYIFVVRAENTHGMSIPSGASNVVRTLGAHSFAPQHLLDNARTKLSNKVLVLRDLFPLSSTSVRVIWDVSLKQL